MEQVKITKGVTVELDGDAKDAVFYKALEAWESRVESFKYDLKTKSGRALATEFLMGVVAALDALAQSEKTQMPPVVYFKTLRGNVVTKEDFLPKEEG